MRRISLVLVVVVALSASTVAAERRGAREERGPLSKIVRVLKTLFGVQTNSDGLTPPLPKP